MGWDGKGRGLGSSASAAAPHTQRIGQFGPTGLRRGRRQSEQKGLYCTCLCIPSDSDLKPVFSNRVVLVTLLSLSCGFVEVESDRKWFVVTCRKYVDATVFTSDYIWNV